MENNLPEKKLLEVPQINPATGLSSNYRNEYVAFKGFFEMGIKKMRVILKEKPLHVKKYKEHFPDSSFKNVITDKNHNDVKKLDKLADRLNNVLNAIQGFDELAAKLNNVHNDPYPVLEDVIQQDFLEIYKEVERLILGDIEYERLYSKS